MRGPRRVRGRHLRLWHAPGDGGPPVRYLRREAEPGHRLGRAFGERQVDVRCAAAAPLRLHRRLGADRQLRRARVDERQLAATHLCGVAGARALRLNSAREHSLRCPIAGHRGEHVGGVEVGELRRVHQILSGGLRDFGRGARHQALRRAEAASRNRPRDDGQPDDLAPRRSDVRPRRRVGGSRAAGAERINGPEITADANRDRPQVIDGAEGGSHHCVEGRVRRRERQARRAAEQRGRRVQRLGTASVVWRRGRGLKVWTLVLSVSSSPPVGCQRCSSYGRLFQLRCAA
mmetsp:Transcript_26242/g.75737  ORF Transcript_26242/g.75737 Transcript_26242/m.75737 type:complete len:290 (+) Transcript_26242:1128-1997(+)